MNYLVDTNVLMELALSRTRAQEAAEFFRQVSALEICVTDYSLHSAGIYIARKNPQGYLNLLSDLAIRQVRVLTLPPSQLPDVVSLMHRVKLDFDDAFQYLAAELNQLTLISFDADFDRTPRGRMTPAQVLAQPLPSP